LSLEDDVSEKVREFLRASDSISHNEDVHGWVCDNFNSHDVDKGSSEYWRLANEGKESYGCWPDCDDVESAVDQLVDDAVRSRISSEIQSVISNYDLDDFEELSTTDPRDDHGDPIRTDENDDEVEIWRIDGEYVGWKHIDISEHGVEPGAASTSTSLTTTPTKRRLFRRKCAPHRP